MNGKRSYVAAAFNARPFGMPVPPNWFAIAAFALLGAFVNPGLWLMGAGLEGLYLWTLARSLRFRAAVDAARGPSLLADRYQLLAANLDARSLQIQAQLERQAAEIIGLLLRVGANEAQVADVRQMAWLHLKLLVAQAALHQVVASAQRDRGELIEQERKITDRLSQGEPVDELQHSLTRQLEVIRSRRAAHQDAESRREIVVAELERLRQQISLVREQALLATDEQSVAQSLDALSASLNEANRWLKDQRELLAGFSDFSDEPPPEEILRRTTGSYQSKQRGELE